MEISKNYLLVGERVLIERNPPRINKIPPTIFIGLLIVGKIVSGSEIKFNPKFKKYNPAIKLTKNKICPPFIAI